MWLGNSRGNSYSRGHGRWAKGDPRYWQFSLHENGYWDLAAALDYVLQETDRQTLYYVGHGHGASALLVLLSARPQYNKRVQLAVHFSPVAFASAHRSRFLAIVLNRLFVNFMSVSIHTYVADVRYTALQLLVDCMIAGCGNAVRIFPGACERVDDGRGG